MKRSASIILIISMLLGCIIMTSCRKDEPDYTLYSVGEILDGSYSSGDLFERIQQRLRKAGMENERDSYVCVISDAETLKLIGSNRRIYIPGLYKKNKVIFLAGYDCEKGAVKDIDIPGNIRYVYNVCNYSTDENEVASVSGSGVECYDSCFNHCSKLDNPYIGGKYIKKIENSFNNCKSLETAVFSELPADDAGEPVKPEITDSFKGEKEVKFKYLKVNIKMN